MPSLDELMSSNIERKTPLPIAIITPGGPFNESTQPLNEKIASTMDSHTLLFELWESVSV